MITYDTGGLQFLFNIIKVHGSVFPKALCSSLPSAAISFAFVILLDPEYFDDPPFRHFAPAEENIMNNNAVWGGFSFLIGFLVVFRTSQAYNRFWEGCTQMHKMGAEWFDACSSLVAFCKHSAVDTELILQFQNTLIRLFSMLHAAALGQIEDTDAQDYSMVVAFNLELIDPESIDDESMEEIRACHEKVELIFQWIQQLIVENIKPGVLSVPPPILSRSFQEIANGMVHFHEAMKIANVPFPFPYAQTCDALLVMHWFMVPFVVAQWATKPWWAAVFSFIQVFTFWCLNLIALELENPFGTDPNDIDGGQMQVEMNERLRLLLRSSTKRTPRLLTTRGSQESLVIKAIAETEDYQRCSSRPSKLSAKGSTSFAVVWKHIDDKIALRETESEAVQLSSAARGTMIAEPSDFQIARDAYDERNKDRGNPPVTSVPATARQEQPIQYQIHNGRHQFVLGEKQDGIAKAANPPPSFRQAEEPPPALHQKYSGNHGGLAHNDMPMLAPYIYNGPQANTISSENGVPTERDDTDGVLEDRIGEILEGVNDEVAGNHYHDGLGGLETNGIQEQEPRPGRPEPGGYRQTPL